MDDIGEIVEVAGNVAKNAGVWKAIEKYFDGKAEAGRMVRIAEAEIEVEDLQAQARRRREMEDIRHQKNMLSVLIKTKGQFNQDAMPDDVEDDWYANFFDKVRNISDEDMQMLWSRILAGEINNPQNFSKRTINLFANFDKEDAKAFANLCSFQCEIPAIKDDRRNFRIFPYIPSNYREHKEYECISEENLIRLEEAGLIIQNFGFAHDRRPTRGHTDGHYFYANHEQRGMSFELKCHDGKLFFKIPIEDGAIPLGVVKFTQVGKELSRIVEQKCANGFLDFLKGHYPLQHGFLSNIDPAVVEMIFKYT